MGRVTRHIDSPHRRPPHNKEPRAPRLEAKQEHYKTGPGRVCVLAKILLTNEASPVVQVRQRLQQKVISINSHPEDNQTSPSFPVVQTDTFKHAVAYTALHFRTA
jgi:hypothetical protein